MATKKRKKKQADPLGPQVWRLYTADRHERDDEIIDAAGQDHDGSGYDLTTGWGDMEFEYTSRAKAVSAARRVKKIRGVRVRLVGEIKV